jgi:hypothetical protein
MTQQQTPLISFNARLRRSNFDYLKEPNILQQQIAKSRDETLPVALQWPSNGIGGVAEAGIATSQSTSNVNGYLIKASRIIPRTKRGEQRENEALEARTGRQQAEFILVSPKN